MKPTLKLGMEMWSILWPSFKATLDERGLDHNQRAQVWAAFIAAAAGGMVSDLNKADAVTILEGVIAATKEIPHLAVVNLGGSRA